MQPEKGVERPEIQEPQKKIGAQIHIYTINSKYFWKWVSSTSSQIPFLALKFRRSMPFTLSSVHSHYINNMPEQSMYETCVIMLDLSLFESLCLASIMPKLDGRWDWQN